MTIYEPGVNFAFALNLLAPSGVRCFHVDGGLALLAGKQGAGKSTTARWFAAGWSRGTISGAWEGEPVNVLYVATEEAWAHTVVPSLAAAGAAPERIKFLALGDGPDRIRINDDKQYVLDVCKSHDIRAVVVDPFMAIGMGADGSNELGDLRDSWVEVSEAIDGVVIGIVHSARTPLGLTTATVGHPLPTAPDIQPRCARTKRDGSVCQSPVARPGDACTWHTHQTRRSPG